MTEEVQGTPQDYSNIYVDDKLFEKVINGVTFKWRELSGEEIIEITSDAAGIILDQVSKDPTKVDLSKIKMDQKTYARGLIDAALVEPKDIDVARLKPSVYAELIIEMEDSMHLTEVMQKNLGKKSTDTTDSTPSPQHSEET